MPWQWWFGPGCAGSPQHEVAAKRMRWMIRLYPRAWQQRYGEEFALVLGDQRASPGMIIDVLGGAVDAWLHPQGYGRKPANEEAHKQGMGKEEPGQQEVGQQEVGKQEVGQQEPRKQELSQQDLDQGLHRQQALQGQGEDTMTNATNAMMRRCATGGPKLSSREQLIAGIWTAAGMLTLSAIYVVLRRLYHGTPAVEALGYTATPGVYVLYLQMAYLRNRPLATQALIVVGVLGSLYLALFAICAVA